METRGSIIKCSAQDVMLSVRTFTLEFHQVLRWFVNVNEEINVLSLNAV